MRLSFGTSVRSRFCKAVVRLLLCKLWFVNNPSMLYRKSLPPSFGTMFIATFGELLSAVAPPVSSAVSSMVSVLNRYPGESPLPA